MTAPHKCPVCEGKGQVVDPRIRDEIVCQTCKGKGIVWEPSVAQEGAAANPGQLDLTYDGD